MVVIPVMLKIIIQVREIDRETREANNITDETM
jgi:hypothetical protein